MKVYEKKVLNLDIGGTNLAVTAGNREHHTAYVLPVRKETTESLLTQIVDIVSQESPDYLVLGVPGGIKLPGGIITQSPNVPVLDGVDLKKELGKRLNIPIEIENDANLIAIGEWAFGSGNREEPFVCLTLGTGVGGGIVIDGKIFHGYSGIAGELGHISVKADGPLCTCGSRGCLEAMFSTHALRERYLFLTEREVAGVKDIYSRFEDGEEAAKSVLLEGVFYLGVGVASILNMLNPHKLCLGGGVASIFENAVLREHLVSTVRERAFKRAFEDVEIVLWTLKDKASFFGALYIADSFLNK